MSEVVLEEEREHWYDEDSGITWVDFTDIVRDASAGNTLVWCAPRVCARACVRLGARVMRPSSSLTFLFWRAELEKGQMMHADSFNLSDSMSALEMMDPKMDAGVVNEKNKYVIPANECFDRGLVDLDPDMAKTLMSMDNILALEMTWLRGTAMVQTLFTCLYCQRPAAIKNNTLRVFCHGVMKTTEVVTKAASRASVHEEEDLSTNTGGFALCQELTEEEVSASLKAEEELLEQRVKAWKSVASGKGGAEESTHNGLAANVGDGSASDPMHGRRLEALLARIRLRRGWYAVVCHLSKGFKSMKSARKSIAYSLSQLARVREGVCLYHDDAAGTLCVNYACPHMSLNRH